jgi:hypothetical protein
MAITAHIQLARTNVRVARVTPMRSCKEPHR